MTRQEIIAWYEGLSEADRLETFIRLQTQIEAHFATLPEFDQFRTDLTREPLKPEQIKMFLAVLYAARKLQHGLLATLDLSKVDKRVVWCLQALNRALVPFLPNRTEKDVNV